MTRYIGTQADAEEVAEIFSTLNELPKEGLHVGPGRHGTMPGTWDGTGAIPYGWTGIYTAQLDSGLVWRVDLSEPDALRGYDATARALLTAPQIVALDLALLRIFPVSPIVEVVRVSDTPVIAHEDIPAALLENISMFSVFRVPAWLASPLGDYYMLFGGHDGPAVYLAYADDAEGPWTIHGATTLSLTTLYAAGFSVGANPHLASPEVRIDDVNEIGIVYFHAYAANPFGHNEGVATTENFIDDYEILIDPVNSGPINTTDPYFRVFEHDGEWYAASGNASLHKSADLDGYFTYTRSTTHPYFAPFGDDMTVANRDADHRPRHAGLWKVGDILYTFWTVTGDSPERIKVARVDLGIPDWNYWQQSLFREVYRPEIAVEGSEEPPPPEGQGGGVTHGLQNSLQNPFVLDDSAYSGNLYLYANGGGEHCIMLYRITVFTDNGVDVLP